MKNDLLYNIFKGIWNVTIVVVVLAALIVVICLVYILISSLIHEVRKYKRKNKDEVNKWKEEQERIKRLERFGKIDYDNMASLYELGYVVDNDGYLVKDESIVGNGENGVKCDKDGDNVDK